MDNRKIFFAMLIAFLLIGTVSAQRVNFLIKTNYPDYGIIIRVLGADGNLIEKVYATTKVDGSALKEYETSRNELGFEVNLVKNAKIVETKEFPVGPVEPIIEFSFLNETVENIALNSGKGSLENLGEDGNKSSNESAIPSLDPIMIPIKTLNTPFGSNRVTILPFKPYAGILISLSSILSSSA